jgi:hypothetical protein
MKAVYFENLRNRERFYCTDVKDVRKIDGVEYLRVFREGTQRDCLVKLDQLRRVSAPRK